MDLEAHATYMSVSDDDEPHNSLREAAIATYRDVWKEFYSWEQEECMRLLRSLETPAHESENLASDYGNWDGSEVYEGEFDFGSHERAGGGRLTFTVQEYASDDDCQTPYRYSTLSCVEATHIKPMIASPPYEMCTPASSSRRTSLWDQSARFAPYADDPEFYPGKLKEYLDACDTFAWQTDFVDPDLELIQLEAARRLYYNTTGVLERPFTFSDIDKTHVFKPLRRSDSSGLIWDMRQRDVPWWTGLPESEDPNLPSDFVQRSLNVFENIQQDIPNFCGNLNCIRTLCSPHKHIQYPPIFPEKPKKTSHQIHRKGRRKRDPCGEHCYLLIAEEDVESYADVEWDDPSDVENLIGILKLIPDDYPCDIAVICRKRCLEVFIYRRKLLSDQDILYSAVDEPRRTFIMPDFIDLEMSGENILEHLTPCYHKGPCDQHSGCLCYQNKQHCQRNCRCSLKCEIRWKGCECQDPGECWERYDCTCRSADRECDPELCRGCNARGAEGKKFKSFCQNTIVQRGTAPPISIKHSEYGFGAFASRPLGKNQMVGDYVGELIPDPGPSNLDILYRHTKRNYLFGLFTTATLDARQLGNETRFLNDDLEGETVNCDSVPIIVNGDHHVVLRTITKVATGKELVLHYGDTYWNRLDSSREGSEASHTEGGNPSDVHC